MINYRDEKEHDLLLIELVREHHRLGGTLQSHLTMLKEYRERHPQLILSVARSAIGRNKDHRLACADLLFIGALYRSWDLLEAIESLITQRNLLVVEALLRLQIDSLLYLNYIQRLPFDDAVWLARGLLSGPRKGALRDRHGVRLTDSFLLSQLIKTYPHLDELYSAACRGVHLSDRLVFAPMHWVGSSSPTFHFDRSKRFSDDDLEGLLVDVEYATSVLHRIVSKWATP